MNPLFPDELSGNEADNDYLLPRADRDKLKPLSHSDNPAVEMIRHKIDAMYSSEPSAKKEQQEVEQLQVPRSKHQEFMHRLTTSGRSMAEIQTAWHNYYTQLPDGEKHEVWQEFYRANAQSREQAKPVASHAPEPPKPRVFVHEEPGAAHGQPDRHGAAAVKRRALKRLHTSHTAQLKAKQHLQSLAFGLGLGALALLIALFGLFNELVVVPFIRPGSAAATPIILDPNAPAPDSTPELIIPKLNAQLPVDYTGQSLDEGEVQKALEDGVFHYPTTATPGQNGNVAIFGHSSNNILNKGKYKFAFVLLHTLEPGDVFYLTYGGKVYTYKVYTKKVVNPDETWILGPVQDKTATATLITCDPPGSTKHRLAVWAEQVSPDPAANSAAAQPSEALQTQELPDNGPSAATRLWHWLNPFD
ncbi:MAG TPA: sortase [Candidatus Pristimantibacillus sp.]|nr:sortase [Candidatus Pristimantibacillus sp.]